MGRRQLPVVSENGLIVVDEGEGRLTSILIESEDWFQWLAVEQNSSFAFQHALGAFTVRRERKGARWYWYAYRKRKGRLHKAYLGKSHEVTLQRLNVAATVLADRDADSFARGTSLPPQSTSTSNNETETELAAHSRDSLPNLATALPAYLTPLLGREQEVQAAASLLQRPEVRLVTLTGPGGIGKTRLGVQIATQLSAHFTDGAVFVPLAPLSDPALVVASIAQVLGIRDTADWSLFERLKAFLRTRQLLLLLDNFEHLLPATPQLVELLTSCPGVKMLITSRAVLRARGEHEFQVSPLALPDLTQLPDHESLPEYAAVALFLQRVQAIKPTFQLSAANARPIAEVCVKLEGLPLALELAAARIKLLSPQALLVRLEDQLRLLTYGARDVSERQQTMRNTIRWSYDLLSVAEQRLFRRVSVFVGGCTLEAIEAVSSAVGDADVLEGIASLVDKSLLQRTEQEGKEPWLVMLESIQEYGREALATCGEAEVTQGAHAAYYLALAEEAEPRLTSAGKERWLERLQREHGNLRAALAWLGAHKEQESALRLGIALWRFWWVRGYLSEGRAELEQALTRREGVVATPVRANALYAAGALARSQGDFEQAEALFGESLTLFRALRDPRGSATSLRTLGYVAMQRSNYAVARTLLEEAVALYRETDDKDDILWALFNLAAVFLYQGEYERALALLQEGSVLARERGDSWLIVNSLYLSATAIVYQGDLPRAHTLAEECLALSRQQGYKGGMGYSLKILGLVALQQGDVETAGSLLQESLALFKELGDRENVPQSLVGLARVSFVQGNYATARALFEESLALFKVVDNKWYMAACLIELGLLATVQGESAWAARLVGAAEALCQAINGVLSPSIRAMQELTCAAVRAQVGEEVFTATWAEGYTMAPEQALAAQEPATMATTAPVGSSSVPQAPNASTHPQSLYDQLVCERDLS